MIFLIDDDQSIRSAFDLFIESLGMEFMSFETAEAFLVNARPTGSDLLILDLSLPGMSGMDLLKRFSLEKSQVTVIVVTAFDDVQSRDGCMHYGVKAYLQKPVDGAALFDLIKNSVAI
jgi:two-component system, LuxR family, response regulator FixJ